MALDGSAAGEIIVKCCNFPTKITSGLTFETTVNGKKYPATLWTAQLLLRGPSVIDVTATADGNNYLFHADATQTASWTTGDYWYSIRVTSGSAVHEIESGQLSILPDMANVAAGYDGRSPNEIALAAIDAVLAKRATLDQERYRINNRELYRTPIADLIKLRDYYRNLVNRERGANCGKNPFGRKVRVVLR